MEKTERLIRIIEDELRSVCYTCSTGTRWHAIVGIDLNSEYARFKR